MGTSLMFRQPVSEMVLSRVPITIGLTVYAMALAAVFTLIFGLLAAVNKGRWIDQAIRVVFLFILTTPNFWFGILLILVLSLALKWFPVAGFGATLPGAHLVPVPARAHAGAAAFGGADPQPAQPGHPHHAV